LKFIIQRFVAPAFYSCYLIEIGRTTQVVDLMSRNRHRGFLGAAQKVMATLGGDQPVQRFVASGDMLHIDTKKRRRKRFSSCAMPWRTPQALIVLPSLASASTGTTY
jgi:hypothetical protein